MLVVLILLFAIFTDNINAGEEYRTVILEQGGVAGKKYWNGDYYEFYGVPYASVPKGRDRFQAPLPVKPWEGVIEASDQYVICPQSHYSGEGDEYILSGQEECLTLNIIVPEIANENNLVPVIVYIHSGAYALGHGNIAKYHYLVRHNIIVVSYNYRLGALGFACLGTKEVPGNAAMKDQVAALKWINKNIKRFGGDPNKVTLAGFSVGAAMAELLALSKTTKGLINNIILESGSALSPFAINRDPISTARNIAISLGHNDTGKIEDLTEFYLNASVESLSKKSLHFFLPNSTFGFAPCIENIHESFQPFLTDSPLDIMNKGEYNDVAVITGFASMEGLSRATKFTIWSQLMNENFADFLPADLIFNDKKIKDNIINKIKQYYFTNKNITEDLIQNYVDYFSDSMFKYSILKSAKLHSKRSTKKVYLYEFSYVGELSMKHNYMDKIKGASHRDQTSYILDFYGWTNKYTDLDTRDRMTLMWSDFVKYVDPTAYESVLIDFKWLPYKNEEPNFLEIGENLQIEKDEGVFQDIYNFWNAIYDEHHWNPKPPNSSKMI